MKENGFPLIFSKFFYLLCGSTLFCSLFGNNWLLRGVGTALEWQVEAHGICFPILCPEGNFFCGVTFTKELSSQSFRLELFWFLAFPLHKKGLKTKRCTAGNPLQGFIWDFCPNAVKNISARRLFICSVLEADQELGLVIGDQPMCKPLKNGVHSNRNQDRVWAGLSWNFSD